MEELFNWLIKTTPWIEYPARLELLDDDTNNAALGEAKKILVSDPNMKRLLQELNDWPGQALKSHKSAGLLIHKLTFIADVGFRSSDPGIGDIIDKITAHRSEDGPFQILTNIHPLFGGSGEDEWVWMLCDAPLLLYALAQFGLADDPRLIDATAYLCDLVRDNGWPCAAASRLGKFHGPGRKDDPCPYANLVMLKALTQFDEMAESKAAKLGVESLLTLWATRRERHPYLFYMGTDFCKLKAPLIWYDILHVTEVLSQFPWAREDPRFLDMVAIIDRKADAQGHFIPESIWMAWKGWDFGQKKSASTWLTFLVWRMKKRSH